MEPHISKALTARQRWLPAVQSAVRAGAAVLIVLWLLGFFAFHVSAGLIHILLVVGVVMLLFHLLRDRSASA
jgi:Family of unknown function (DUF5670)